MTNLGGHDMDSILEAFEARRPDRPVCFIAYTIKGFGLPFQGHKDNHAGLMTRADGEAARGAEHQPGEEWDQFAGLALHAGRSSRRSCSACRSIAEGPPPADARP